MYFNQWTLFRFMLSKQRQPPNSPPVPIELIYMQTPPFPALTDPFLMGNNKNNNNNNNNKNNNNNNNSNNRNNNNNNNKDNNNILLLPCSSFAIHGLLSIVIFRSPFWLRDSERGFAQAQEKKGLSLVLKPLVQALVSFKKIISRLGLLFLGAASVILEQYESKISVAEERRSKPETSGQNQRGGWTSPSSSAVEVPHRLRICLPSIEGLELG